MINFKDGNNMNSSVILLNLLRIALGNSAEWKGEGSVDWKEVIGLARKQGVLAIAFDALEKVPAELRPSKNILLEWFGRVNTMEQVYELYVNTIKDLGRLIGSKGLYMMVMKGYGCSLHYPKPNHRPCGDIDIFLMDKEGRHDEEMVKAIDDVVAKETGAQISYDDEHHSIFAFGKCTVENHATVLNVSPYKVNIWINDLLEELAKDSTDEAALGLVLPSARFFSIHLLRHMATDFATEKTTLRHVLDWATFVKYHSDEIDWGFVRDVAHRAKMHLFLDALNGICVEYLGYPKEMFPVEKENVRLRDRVLGDILHPEFQDEVPPMEKRIAYGIVKTKRLWVNRWKHRMVFDESILSTFWHSAIYRMRH